MAFPVCCAVIVAAGRSVRMGGETPKQFLPLCGLPVLAHTLSAFEKAETISSVVVVARGEDFPPVRKLARSIHAQKLAALVSGGETRQTSVFRGIAAVPKETAYYAVHDGARPLVLPEEIDNVVRDAFQWGASTLAAPVKDTVKFADESGFVESTPDRERLWAVQTPQVFEACLYQKAMGAALRKHADYTDDCQLVEQIGASVHLCRGGYRNLKLTTTEDLCFAEAILKGREAE